MNVWTPGTIGSIHTVNRFVHTAAGEGMATPEGDATPRLLERYRMLGRGGAIGLIITGHAFVLPQGKMRTGQLGAYEDKQIRGLAAIAAAAKQDGSRIFLQLSHGGIMTMRSITGQEAAGPSPMSIRDNESNRAMTRKEIETLVIAFAEAARRAREAGFDGVQLHAAHGYALCQFFSPLYNRRQDAYGGAVENRARIIAEILQETHRRAGDDFPVTAKVNGRDDLDGGLSLEESVRTVEILERSGLAGVEISGGSCVLSPTALGPMRPVHPVSLKGACYFAGETRVFRRRLHIPVTLVGGIRRLKSAEQALADGTADFVGLCRPLIREPDLLLRWRAGREDAPTCLSCNRCVDLCRTEAGVHCPVRL